MNVWSTLTACRTEKLRKFFAAAVIVIFEYTHDRKAQR